MRQTCAAPSKFRGPRARFSIASRGVTLRFLKAWMTPALHILSAHHSHYHRSNKLELHFSRRGIQKTRNKFASFKVLTLDQNITV